MAFDLYTFVTSAAGLKAGDAFTLPYAAGRTVAKYRSLGAHFARGPNNFLVKAPSKFTVAFNAPSIGVTWSGPTIGPAVVLKFQFESVDGNIGLDGKEIAHASGDNIDLLALGLQPQNSPIFTGNPTAPTPSPGDNDTSIATTAFVATAIANLVASSPAALDTLAELAAALGNDANFATTMTNALALKAPKAGPQFTGLVDISQAIKVTGDLVPPILTTDVNDYAPTGFASSSLLELTSNASRTVTGLAGGAHGRLLLLTNAGANPIVLADQSASSSASNRFAFGVNRTLSPGRWMILLYDNNDARWHALAAEPDLTPYATITQATNLAVAMAVAL